MDPGLPSRRSSRFSLSRLNPFSSETSISSQGDLKGSSFSLGRSLSRKSGHRPQQQQLTTITPAGADPPPAYTETNIALPSSATARTQTTLRKGVSRAPSTANISTNDDEVAFLASFDTVFLIDDSASNSAPNVWSSIWEILHDFALPSVSPVESGDEPPKWDVPANEPPATDSATTTLELVYEYPALGVRGLEAWRHGPGRKKGWNAFPVQKRPTRRKTLRKLDHSSPPRSRLYPSPGFASCVGKREIKKHCIPDDPEPTSKILKSSRKGKKRDHVDITISQDERRFYEQSRPKYLNSTKEPQGPQEPQEPQELVSRYHGPSELVYISTSSSPQVLDMRQKKRLRLVDDCYKAFENVQLYPSFRPTVAADRTQLSWAEIAKFPQASNSTASLSEEESSVKVASNVGKKSRRRGIPGISIPQFDSFERFVAYVNLSGEEFLRKCWVLGNMAVGREQATQEVYQKLFKIVKKRKAQLFPLLDSLEFCGTRTPKGFLSSVQKGMGSGSVHFCFASFCFSASWFDHNQERHVQNWLFLRDEVIRFGGQSPRAGMSWEQYLNHDPERRLQHCQLEGSDGMQTKRRSQLRGSTSHLSTGKDIDTYSKRLKCDDI
ncbi:hypothetical protein PG991_015271 [Apiospora marii]|uniref:Uncharacterized protein n=1 Tax=Apiospora marii TaxID=335849 RepID=A0ABR1R164_9PEZI